MLFVGSASKSGTTNKLSPSNNEQFFIPWTSHSINATYCGYDTDKPGVTIIEQGVYVISCNINISVQNSAGGNPSPFELPSQIEAGIASDPPDGAAWSTSSFVIAAGLGPVVAQHKTGTPYSPESGPPLTGKIQLFPTVLTFVSQADAAVGNVYGVNIRTHGTTKDWCYISPTIQFARLGDYDP